MRFFIAAALCATAFIPGAASAQPASASPRVNQLIVYGNDKCPESTDEVITVCAHKPEGERYRIPENLRDVDRENRSQSWTSRVDELQYVGKGGIGSCSAVGPGGIIGCWDQLMRQARAERAAGDGTDWDALIEKARQERLGRIDADSEAIDQQLKAEGK